MQIDLSNYYLGEPDKTVCHCGHPVHFLTPKEVVVPNSIILCTNCGEIATIGEGGQRIIIAEGDKIESDSSIT